MMKRVLVLGSTGAVGKEIVKELVKHDNISITTFGRRKYPFFPDGDARNDKINQEIFDFDKIKENEEEFTKTPFDCTFCSLGTTRKRAGSAEAFVKVDYHYVVKSAEALQKSGCKAFYLVSSLGANANSWFLYPQTKGKTEEALKQLGFPMLFIYRPSVLVAERENDSRFLEHLSVPFSNLFPTYESMPTEKLAQCMVHHYLNEPNVNDKPVVEVIENRAIHQYFLSHLKKQNNNNNNNDNNNDNQNNNNDIGN